MLEFIRNKTKSLTVLLIFGAIILVFVFWGATPGGNKLDGQVVATIDGEPVMIEDYMELYQRQVDYYKNTFKAAFTPEMAEEMNLKYLTLDILINRAVALKAAKDLGITATLEEVQAQIGSISAFHVDGVFNKEQYIKVLGANRLKPGPFEETIGDDIVSQKVRESVTANILISDEEMRTAYMHEFREIDLKFVGFDPAHFKATVEVTDEEAGKYLETNAERFTAPLKVKAFYANVDYNDIRDSVTITAKDIQDYYDRNLQSFAVPAKVKARHILVRPDLTAADTEASKEEAKRKAAGILKRLKKGENFKGLAIRYSEDPGSSSKGGDLGWFARGVMVKQFEGAAFTLAKDEISELVESPFGFHIIQLLDKKDAGVEEIEVVTPEIKRELTRLKARSKADELVRALEVPFMDAADEAALRAVVSPLPEVRWGVTPLFAANDPSTELLANETLRGVAFTMNSGEASKAIETETGIYILKVLERVEPHVPGYTEISRAVKSALVETKTRYEASTKAEEFLSALKGGSGFDTVKVDGMGRVEQTGLFGKRETVVPTIGAVIAENGGLFTLTLDAPVYETVLESNGTFYVLTLTDLKEPSTERLDNPEFAGRMRSALKSEKDDRVLGDWLEGLRKGSEILVYDENL
ncbi:MAG: SurA N-terminal domain-containing protein [Proteobacteria bacterium]|nr:SurA N-terminal domain-containing protein [Pseudomonadota bacterium]